MPMRHRHVPAVSLPTVAGALAAFLILAVLLAACASAGAKQEPATPTEVQSPAEEPSPTPIVPGAGTISTSFDAECHLTQYGAAITFTYSARASGEVLVNRVRLRLDGRTVEDSGAIFSPNFERTTSFTARAGAPHSYQVITNTLGRPPFVGRAVVRCPKAPEGFQT